MGCTKCINRTYCTECDEAGGYKFINSACVCKDESFQLANHCFPCNLLIDHCLTCFTRVLCKAC